MAETKTNSMTFTHLLPGEIKNLNELLMAIMFVRNFNKQADTIFTKREPTIPQTIVYHIRHKTPPLLQAFLHLDFLETLYIQDLEKGELKSVIESTDDKGLTITTHTVYKLNAKSQVETETQVYVNYQNQPIPKILQKPIVIWTRKRTNTVRKHEVETFRELFTDRKFDARWKPESLRMKSSFL